MKVEERDTISQDDSGLLRAGRLIQFSNHADKAINTIGFQEYDTWIQDNNLRFGPSSPDELREIKAGIIDGTYDVDKAKQLGQQVLENNSDDG